MLDVLDESLRNYLNATAQLADAGVDLSFDAPDSQWAATTSKPTVNVFLWDLGPYGDEVRSGVSMHGSAEDRKRQLGRKRLAAQYMITVWGTDVRSEHLLIGAITQAVFTVPFLGEEHLTGVLEEMTPQPTLRVGMLEERGRGEFWNSLGGRVRAGLDVVVSFTVPSLQVDAGPPVGTFSPSVRGYDGTAIEDTELLKAEAQ